MHGRKSGQREESRRPWDPSRSRAGRRGAWQWLFVIRLRRGSPSASSTTKDTPFADIQALEGPCDAVSLFYWPHHGWIVASPKAADLTKAQLVTEGGSLAWEHGRTLGGRWRSLGPPSFAADTRGSFVFVQWAGIDADADHVFAYRYDAELRPRWPRALDLGVFRKPASGKERITLERPGDGFVRVTPPTGMSKIITSEGTIR